LNTGTNALLSQYVYGYDPAGNRTSEQIGLGVTQTNVNALDQITSTGAGGPLQFSGTLSEPSQVTVGGNTATYGNYYSTNFTGMAPVTPGTNIVSVVAHDVNGNTATNKYQVVVPPGSSATPAYDADGNLTSNGNGQAYTWDARNELLSITYANGASSLFTYDGIGRRVLIVEKNSSGTVTGTKQFVWRGTTLAEERDAGNSVTKRFFPQGEQISGSPYYYTRDHLGSVREMVDNSGNIQARYDYDPYGRVTKVSHGQRLSVCRYYAHLPSSLNLTLFRA
jgi:YD repeat-containing protein